MCDNLDITPSIVTSEGSQSFLISQSVTQTGSYDACYIELEDHASNSSIPVLLPTMQGLIDADGDGFASP